MNPFNSYDDENLSLSIQRLIELLEGGGKNPKTPTYLGSVVCSREDYSRPAVTFSPTATREDTLRELRSALEGPREGWKGGIYQFTPSSLLYFNFSYGECGFEATPANLEIMWSMAEALLKEES